MAIPRGEILVGQVLGTLVGLALIIVGVGLWTRAPGPSVTTVTQISNTRASGQHGPPARETLTTTTTVAPTAATTTTPTATATPNTKPPRSPAVTVGLVASGALLLLGASWLPRLRSLTVPASPSDPDEPADDDDDE